MFVTRFSLALLASLVLASSVGCKKEPAPTNQPATAATNQTAPAKFQQSSASASIARIHWLGKKRLATETNAAYFMTIWNLPESGKLEAQTLDKLALWLANARPALSNAAEITNYSALVSSNAAASTLRPLVQDLLLEEWLLDISQPSNSPPELALAIRLNEQRNTAWQAAQTTLRDSLSALCPAPLVLSLTRSGNWTLLGIAESSATNSLLSTLTSQTLTTGEPFRTRATNYWIEADIDLLKLSRIWPLLAAFNRQLSTNWPTVNLQAIGDGANVRTHAEFEFPQRLNVEMDAWNIPTNLIHDPLIGFTAIRGIRPLLKNFKPWNDLQLGTPPNQAYIWAQNGAPWLHFAAFPSVEASNQVSKIGDFALNNLNPIFETNPIKLGEFEREPGSERLGWRGMPLMSPTLDCSFVDGTSLILAGFYPNRLTNAPIPVALLPQVYATSNLVYYDWEITGPCLRGLTPINQLVRRLFNRERLPAEPSIAWLTALGTRLGNSATATTLTRPQKLSCTRKSSIGLTAVELSLLVDWLQSPAFPQRLHSLIPQYSHSARAHQLGQ